MRIPGVNPARGAQSLGRRDIYAPLRVANAEARAAQYEGQGLLALGQVSFSLSDFAQARADQNATAEYNREILKAKAEVQRALGMVDRPTLPVDAPGMENLEFQRELTVPSPEGGTQLVPRSEVPTYEVGGQWLEQRLNSVRDAALANLNDPRAIAKFESEWAAIAAKSHTATATKLYEQRRSDQRGAFELQLDQYAQMQDEEGGRALIYQAFASRVITGEELSAAIEELGEQVDAGYYGSRLALADDPGALDALMEEVEAGVIVDPETGEARTARLDPEQLWAIRQRANTKATQYEEERTDRYRRGGTRAAEAFIRGELTDQQLLAMLASDQISAQQAITFESKLHTRAREAPLQRSNVEALDGFRREIRDIRWTEGGAGRVSSNRDRLQEKLYLAANGISRDGSMTGDVTITGQDYDTLLSELDAEFTRIDGDPRYKQAVDTVRSITGVYEGFDMLGDSANAQLRAFDTGKRMLDDYLDRYGADADPVAWVAANRDFFDPNLYAERSRRSFVENWGPRLYRFFPAPVAEQLIVQGPGWVDTWSELSSEQLRAAIYSGIRAGELSYEEAAILYDQLSMRTEQDAPGALEGVFD